MSDDLIETMVEAFWNAGGRVRPWSALNDGEQDLIRRRFTVGLREAYIEGFVLAKLPDAMEPPVGFGAGWNNCLRAIETIEIDKEPAAGSGWWRRTGWWP